MGTMIKNPILPGFNADPSICRVGDDYYIATSTFEWYPGVQIHHSTDLTNWKLVKRPLDRASQLDMRGNPDSCGVWAPCLSHADGLFWLVYTDVKRYDGNFKDTPNYVVTSPTIEGPWSDPVYLNSSGFDPSLFHDDDGRKWLVNMQWNHRPYTFNGQANSPRFDGIPLQEYDPATRKLVGPIVNIFAGSSLGLVEGPHLFKRNGYYYLTVAEGGTGYQHAVTMARSKSLTGPYELHPDQHLISSRHAPQAELQRAGHGQMVETQGGDVYHTHLCSRPLAGLKSEGVFRSPLGRETSLQKCVWGDDDWLRLENGGQVPSLFVPAPDGARPAVEPVAQHYQFAGEDLPIDFQWLRTPEPQRIFSMSARADALRIVGRESIGSWFEQGLVARRQEDLDYRAETTLEFMPDDYQQAAGLTTYYNRHKFHFLAVTMHEELGRVLTIISCNGDYPESQLSFPLANDIPLDQGPVRLAVEVRQDKLQFFYRVGDTWTTVGPVLDASLISDEGGRGEHASFTGAFVGMAVFDVSGRAKSADFTAFSYLPLASMI